MIPSFFNSSKSTPHILSPSRTRDQIYFTSQFFLHDRCSFKQLVRMNLIAAVRLRLFSLAKTSTLARRSSGKINSIELIIQFIYNKYIRDYMLHDESKSSIGLSLFLFEKTFNEMSRLQTDCGLFSQTDPFLVWCGLVGGCFSKI